MTYHVEVAADIWTILTAIGTVGAVVAALLGTWYGVNASRRERDRLEDREAESEARKVLILHTLRAANDDTVPMWARTILGIEVVNAGREPILDARLLHASSNPTVPSMKGWQWWPGNGGASHTQVVLPGASHAFRGSWKQEGGDGTQTPSSADRGWFTATVTWTDARNRHWVRRGSEPPVELGKPTQYGEDPEPKRRTDRSSGVITETTGLWRHNQQLIADAEAQYEATHQQEQKDQGR